MSDELENMSPEHAEQVLREVGGRVFFDKLAQWNIVPPNEKVAEQFMQLGDQLLLLEQQEMQKQASTGDPFLADTINRLSGVMQNSGIPVPQQAEQDTFAKQAAIQYAQNDVAAHAALKWAELLLSAETAAAQ